MVRYVALLRGINVGGNSKVPMKDLKLIFEELGHENVITYINSGNVIFSTKTESVPTLVKNIEKAIEKKFGFRVPVILRDAKSIQNLCKKIPQEYLNDKEYKTDILFLWHSYDTKDTLKKIQQNPEVDALQYLPGAIVWNIKRSNYTKSKMNKLIGTEVYKNMTIRNINTLRKLKGMMEL